MTEIKAHSGTKNGFGARPGTITSYNPVSQNSPNQSQVFLLFQIGFDVGKETTSHAMFFQHWTVLIKKVCDCHGSGRTTVNRQIVIFICENAIYYYFYSNVVANKDESSHSTTTFVYLILFDTVLVLI
jgi:hypothetical protein